MRKLIVVLSSLVGMLAVGSDVFAIEIPGKVVAVKDDVAMVRIASQYIPLVGDKAEISFEIAGLDERAIVATGKVAKVADNDIHIKIERTTGKVMVGHLATIYSENPAKRVVPAFLLFPLRRNERTDLYLLSGDGKILANVSQRDGDCIYPAWSAKGDRIVFTMAVEGNQGVYVMDADGSNSKRLTNYRSDVVPAWSPDGKKIAFTRFVEHAGKETNYDVLVIPADGGEAVNLTASCLATDADPAWSPDGKRIVFTSKRSGNFRLYSMDPDGKNVTELSGKDAGNNGIGYVNPAWSPDGKSIAYTDASPEGLQIFILDIERGTQRQLTKLAAIANTFAAWSPDGRRLAFASRGEKHGSLFIMNADGSDLREVLSKEPIRGGERPAWKPSGLAKPQAQLPQAQSQAPKSGWLGVNLIATPKAAVEALQLVKARGAQVDGIVADSPAAEARVKRGDIVVRVAEHEVQDTSHFVELILQYAPQQSVTMTVMRDGQRLELRATLATKPADYRQRVEAVAQQGEAWAQHTLGLAYRSGEGGPKDLAAAAAWFRKAAEQGHASGQMELGAAYEFAEGLEQNVGEALAWYRKAAAQDSAGAQYRLGVIYTQGKGVEKDLGVAAGWFQKAADQGNAPSLHNLGLAYEEGRGVPKDMAKALALYRKAADKGHANAITVLGLLYYEGKGVEKNLAESAKCFRQAAEKGSAFAQYYLALSYRKGEGLEKSDEQAVAWFRKAADQSYALAQVHLAWHYENGRGVEKNVPEAVRYYRLAAAQGNKDAQKALQALGK